MNTTTTNTLPYPREIVRVMGREMANLKRTIGHHFKNRHEAHFQARRRECVRQWIKAYRDLDRSSNYSVALAQIAAEEAAQKEPTQETPCVTLKRIVVREWFQRTMGSTYHTVTFEMTNGNTFKTPRAYGYGDQYKTYAADLAQRHGVVLPKDSSGWIKWHELDVAIIAVKARKDL